MAVNPKKRLALDTNVLLDLAAGHEFAHDFRNEFQTKGYDLLVPPTTVIELHLLSVRGGGSQRTRAECALQNLIAWRCHPFPLSDLETTIADQFRARLSLLGLIPDEEWNDGLILAEAALAEIPLLVTSDRHLLHIDEDRLRLAFNEADLSMVHPVHPRPLVRALR